MLSNVRSALSKFFCLRPKTNEDNPPKMPPSGQTIQSNPQSDRVRNRPRCGAMEMQLRSQLATTTQDARANARRNETLFEVRPLENNDVQRTGRVAIFGVRHHLETGKEVNLFAPISDSHRNMDMEYAQLHSFVRCADGEVRRYPKIEDISNNVESQIARGKIYDSHKNHIVEHVAGYTFSARDRNGAFEVSGIKQKPIFKTEHVEVYKLDQNRHMVPQPNFRSCTYACENMMLMDREYLSADKPIKMLNLRRDIEDILHSIKRNTGGVEPILVNESFDLKKTNSNSINRLRDNIKKWGPCMIWWDGHTRMLDEIRGENGKYLFTVRDPLHGSCNTIKGLQALFPKEPGETFRKGNLNAIFLPARKSPEATAS